MTTTLPPTDLAALQAALAIESAAAGRCMAAAGLTAPAPDQRQRAMLTAIDAYERAARTVDLVLGLLLAGPCPGLLAALQQATEAAHDGLIATHAIADGDAHARAHRVAEHAWALAAQREQRVVEAVVLPYWQRRLEALRGQACG